MDALTFKPPTEFDFDGPNVSATWKKWLKRFDLFLLASGNDGKADTVKIAMLISALGETGFDIHNNFTFENDGDKEYKTVCEKFTTYCNARNPVLALRGQFWEYSRPEGQGLDAFVNDLRTMAANCQFDNVDSMIRDKLFFSIKDPSVKVKVMGDDGNAALNTVIQRMRTFESAKRELTMIKSEKEVHAIQSKPQNRQSQWSHERKPSVPHSSEFRGHKSNSCTRCGTQHQPRNCPAYGRTCGRCGRRNHYSNLCTAPAPQLQPRSQTRGQPGRFGRGRNRNRGRGRGGTQVHSIDEYDTEYETYYIDTLEQDNATAWFAPIGIGSDKVQMKLDSGADTNCMPLNVFRKLTGHQQIPVHRSNAKLSGYGKYSIDHVGKVNLRCKAKNGRSAAYDFYVTTADGPPILGREACSELGLVKLIHTNNLNSRLKKFMSQEQLVNENSDVFNGLGQFKEPYDIKLKPDVSPKVHPPRRVPLAIHARLKQKLDEMESTGVIRKTTKPTDWVNSLVVVEKKDKSLRLCLDPKDLNLAIKREHYMIPTSADVISQMAGKKLFTVLDQKDSYWQVALTEASTDLCTFNTPFGRYSFQRMPFGISSASEVLQRLNQQIFGDIPNVHIIADDMIIATDTEEQHDATLNNVMERAREQGIKFNKSKIKFKQTEIIYVGNIVSQDGLKPEVDKVKAIQEMPTPTNREELLRIMGMLNFLAQFIPNMSTISAPLRSLLKKDTPWHWFDEQSKALETLKSLISSNPVLKYFDVTKPTVIQCDASSTGLGACLLQENHPIAYASRSLTTSEKNYSQIEKELLAICFATQKFNHYIYGRRVQVQSDHKPLEMITRKPLHKASPRLQQMLLRLMKYDLNVTYHPGKHMYIADTLSRAYTTDNSPEDSDDDLELRVHTMTETLPMSNARLEYLKKTTAEDEELQAVIRTSLRGWPTYRKDVSMLARTYWHVRDEIHIEDGLVFVADRVVIPVSQREEMMSKLHDSHLGMEKCKARARAIMYWPRMSEDIEELIASCAICAKFRRKNIREPMIPHEVPLRPWSKLGSDIFTYNGVDHLLVVDYFSKYPEVVSLRSKTTKEVISKLKAIFARHGIPDVLMSDNMPYSSYEMKAFAAEWNFDLVTSSPTYAQSNGQSERFVQTIKQLMRKAAEEGKDIYRCLLDYRDSPIGGVNATPAQLLMGRRLKTVLPVTLAKLKPRIIQNSRANLVNRQKVMVNYYNRGKRSLPKFKTGDPCRILQNRTWERATVINPHKSPRSYNVVTQDGGQYRRNRVHLAQDPDKSPLEIVPDSPVETYPNRVVTMVTPPAEPPDTPSVHVPLPIVSSRPVRSKKLPDKFKDYVVTLK